MALTVALAEAYVPGSKRAVRGTITPDTNYPQTTGGWPLTRVTIGLDVIDRIVFESKNGWAFNYDLTNQKVKAWTSGGTEVVNGVDISSAGAVTFVAEGA